MSAAPGADALRTDSLLRRLVRRDAATALNKFIARLRIEDLAEAVQHLTWDEQRRLYLKIEDQDLAAQLLTFLPPESVREVTAAMTSEQVANLLDKLEPDDATDIVGELPENIRVQVIAELQDDRTGEELKDLLEYPTDSAGGIMHPAVFTVRDNTTCGEAIARLQGSPEEHEVIYYLYVVDPADRLVGVTSLRSLLSNPPKTPIVQIMTHTVISVSPLTDQEEVARFVARYDLLAIPVVDSQRHILGVVTVDDVVDVLREEAAEDLLLMAGVNAEPEHSVLQQTRSRAGWLVATLVGGVVASEVVSQYSSTLQAVAALAGFIPVIMGMGGNVGIQSATLTVRGIATGRLQPAAPLVFIWQQMRVSVLLGGLFSVLLTGFGVLRHAHNPLIGLSAGMSLFVAICLSGSLGAIMPVGLQRFGVDPAIATGPVVTTMVDVISVLVYFNIARLLLGL